MPEEIVAKVGKISEEHAKEHYEKIGRAVVGLYEAALNAGHERIITAAEQGAIPGDDSAEAEFVIDMFTKTVAEIKAEWIDEEE